jgi:hypothetical protein
MANDHHLFNLTFHTLPFGAVGKKPPSAAVLEEITSDSLQRLYIREEGMGQWSSQGAPGRVVRKKEVHTRFVLRAGADACRFPVFFPFLPSKPRTVL